jgi:Amino acid permeases
MNGILLGLHLIKQDIFEFIPSGVKYLGAGASTMFCIWYMHCVLPLVLKINDWNPAKAKKSVLVGMVIPALAYAGWMLLIFSLVSRQEFLKLETIGDIMHYALTKPGVPTIISTLVGIFAAITVLTAFLSIGFALVAFVIDALGWKDNAKSRLISTLISFVIPVIVALSFPKAFVIIYQQSNMFQIGAALIPVAAAYVYNKKHNLTLKPQFIILILGCLIIISQILDDLSILPVFH